MTTTDLDNSPFNGPFSIVTPNCSPKFERKLEALSTLAIPSAPQKRASAKGRSAEIHNTIVLSRLAAFALNSLTDVAQVGVSTEGKIFRIRRLPWKSEILISDKSVLVNPAACHVLHRL
eukprot:TRINITY_DN122027_c0_g1_i1.p1 TRINITY_DN122027_c0_g1~~TRINITY_DN122027_c0_g1_i1.p1  ORF type:complete len:119 (-),score=2.61 TRINITY_DN122027_c0_g1_i1:28-384(-)